LPYPGKVLLFTDGNILLTLIVILMLGSTVNIPLEIVAGKTLPGLGKGRLIFRYYLNLTGVIPCKKAIIQNKEEWSNGTIFR